MQNTAAEAASLSASPFNDEPEVVAMTASHVTICAPKGRWVTIMCPVGFSSSSAEGLDLSKPLFARVRYIAG